MISRGNGMKNSQTQIPKNESVLKLIWSQINWENASIPIASCPALSCSAFDHKYLTPAYPDRNGNVTMAVLCIFLYCWIQSWCNESILCARQEHNVYIHKSTFVYVHDTPDEVHPINFAYKFPSFRRSVEIACEHERKEKEKNKHTVAFFPMHLFIGLQYLLRW